MTRLCMYSMYACVLCYGVLSCVALWCGVFCVVLWYVTECYVMVPYVTVWYIVTVCCVCVCATYIVLHIITHYHNVADVSGKETFLHDIHEPHTLMCFKYGDPVMMRIFVLCYIGFVVSLLALLRTNMNIPLLDRAWQTNQKYY